MSGTESADILELLREAWRLRFEQPDQARQLSARAVAECRHDQTRRRELIKGLKILGQLDRDANNLDAALKLYEEAVTICRALGDPTLLAHTIRHVGDIHQDAGRNNLAEPCYLEALSIYRACEHTDLLDLANAIRPLAMVRESGGHVEEAKQLFAEARDLYRRCNISAGVKEMSRRLALLQ
jgi:tetratricopeptide (TPR) repeat protein